MEKQRIIACDFDGTLSEYTEGDVDKFGPGHLGAPIPEMVKKVKQALADGDKVVIFTARTNPIGHDPKDLETSTRSYLLIAEWCRKYLGTVLPITHEKSVTFSEYWDDKAVGVIPNTGVFVTELMDAK
jgi:hypothetical protein